MPVCTTTVQSWRGRPGKERPSKEAEEEAGERVSFCFQASRLLQGGNLFLRAPPTGAGLSAAANSACTKYVILTSVSFRKEHRTVFKNKISLMKGAAIAALPFKK